MLRKINIRLAEKLKNSSLGGGAPEGGGGGYWENTINSTVPVRVFRPPPPQAALPPQWGNYQLQGFSLISLKDLAAKRTKKCCKTLLARPLSYSADPNIKTMNWDYRKTQMLVASLFLGVGKVFL